MKTPPRIIVIGIGGAGANIVKNMIERPLTDCEFCVCNTDSQALKLSPAKNTFLLGKKCAYGLGVGGNPDIGRQATEQSLQQIADFIHGADMVFLASGMGGGTGTGGIPVIAEMIQGIPCAAMVTKPFAFENTDRIKIAEGGIEKLKPHVDTLLVVPNENLITVMPEKASFMDALNQIDNIFTKWTQRGINNIRNPANIPLKLENICKTANEKIIEVEIFTHT